MLDTDLKTQSDFKRNFFSSFVFIRELLLLIIIIIISSVILFDSGPEHLTFIILLVFFSLIYLHMLGRKRNNELDEIKTIINNIRKNKYQSQEEIELDPSLLPLQKAIKEMFIKTREDIEYLQRLQKVRSQFLANVSHELRTPIFTIQGYIETLLSGAVNDSKVNMHFLQKANQNTISLSNLLNDLIDISMIESGEMRMSYRFFKISDLITEIIQANKKIAEDKKLLLTHSSTDSSLQVFGDREKIRQVLSNLVQNAIKYTEKGRVEILAYEDNQKATITVKDTGIGIPGKYLDRIFERFFRVDKARSRSIGGTGLGLAIVKHIIEAHGSKVSVSSTVGEGSEFSFQLKK